MSNPLTIGGTAYSTLLNTLNTWVDDQPTDYYRLWGIESVTNDGYPILIPPATYWTDIGAHAESFSQINEDETTVTITSAEELGLLAYYLNNDSVEDSQGNLYAHYTVILGEDIDLSEYLWAPIGDNQHVFNGVFDGSGKTIST